MRLCSGLHSGAALFAPDVVALRGHARLQFRLLREGHAELPAHQRPAIHAEASFAHLIDARIPIRVALRLRLSLTWRDVEQRGHLPGLLARSNGTAGKGKDGENAE